ncbi:glyoxalase/bleomycin resistance protein/dihydroxybiphenyl dioxygenase [Paenibacillus sp. 32O-W]|nr:glyoxalase/bleomycin resistance protein/dihydroxybiphenyl dioxygenase [Paenibacillus sp. 32O-W]
MNIKGCPSAKSGTALMDGEKIFEALREGGQVGMPLQETFWSPAYGIVTDKFGVTFHITTEGGS